MDDTFPLLKSHLLEITSIAIHREDVGCKDHRIYKIDGSLY
jgi:hypothetical protein